jgi:hypothetical protein
MHAQIDFEGLANEMVAQAEQVESCRFETRGTLRMRAERELPVMMPRAKRTSGWRVLAAVGIAAPVLLGMGCGILAHAQAEAMRREQALLAAPIARHAVIRSSLRPIAAPAAEIETIEPAHPVAHARPARALPRAAEAPAPAPPMPSVPSAPAESLSPSVIQKGLASVRDRVRACKDKLPAGATVVNAEVVIARDGSVSEVGVDGLGTDDADATKCLEQAISEAQFPPFTGEPRIVRYPFTLK